MGTRFTYKKSRSFFVMTFLMLALGQYTVMSQGHYAEKNGYGKASYNLSHSGKFMQSWLVSGPFFVSTESTEPDNALQEKAFKTEKLPGLVSGTALPLAPKEYSWQLISGDDNIVNLDSFYKGKDYVYVYAMAEIRTSAPTGAILAIGSDDGLKVWHNGKLVHENWIARGLEKDNDLIPLKLVKGSNQLVLKVQDMQGGWAFSARLLDKAALTE